MYVYVALVQTNPPTPAHHWVENQSIRVAGSELSPVCCADVELYSQCHHIKPVLVFILGGFCGVYTNFKCFCDEMFTFYTHFRVVTSTYIHHVGVNV